MRKIPHFMLFILAMSLFNFSRAQIKTAESDTGSMLCVGNHWTEEEGSEFLEQMRQSYTTSTEWKARAEKIRQHILENTGLETFPKKNPLNPVMGKIREYEDYTVQNVAFESLPGVYVTGSLYRPVDTKGEIPGILSPHGHGPEGRYSADSQKRFASLARMGAMVWAYDMIGYGQMAELGWEHRHPEALKLQLWNSIRGIDFLLEMGADPDRIGATGASGGGTQTFMATAVDDRIAVAAPVVMVSAHFFGGCVCESGLPVHKGPNFQTNNVEIAALAAPRPLLLVSVGNDWTLNTPQVELPHIRYIYSLVGQEDLAENVHLPDDHHGYDDNKRIAVYPFLAKYLDLDLSKGLKPDGTLNEDKVIVEDQKALYPFDRDNPFPTAAVKHNDGVRWE